jgi:hypothetical protein
MPDFEIRRVMAGNRREGRRSHAAYGPHARGIRPLALGLARPRGPRQGEAERVGRSETEGFSAGIALALVFPLVGRMRAAKAWQGANGAALSKSVTSEGTGCMKRKPSIKSLETISLDEAEAYLEHASGDELNAAYALAWDRNRLDGSLLPPDDAEVHHAFFLLCRARGKHAPSFDEMRVELRRRVAA